MTVGVTKAVELGARHVICASTGNTSASLAAYAARAGIKCTVLIPSGKIAYGKLAQAMIHGAKVLQVRGNFDQALEFVLKLAEKHKSIYLLNSINPFRIEGQKSLGYEICEQLNNEAPDRIIIPVGNAGNISAVWKGLTEFHKLGYIKTLPKMTGIQASGSAPIVQAIKTKSDKIIPVENPETVATAIRIGAPVSWKKAVNAIHESHGTAETVTDEEILDAQKMLARIEGIFVEPASASSIAGLKKLVRNGVINRDERVVCITTGHGLKDPDTAIKQCEKPVEVDAEISAIEQALGLKSQKSHSCKVKMKVRIILVGYGVVGKGVTTILARRYAEKVKDYGFNPKIVAIADIDGAVINPRGFSPEKLEAIKQKGLSNIRRPRVWTSRNTCARSY